MARKRKAYYILRKSLIPWKFEETIDEIKSYCLENSVEEVIWMLDGEEFNHGLLPLDTLKTTYIPLLKEAKAKLDTVKVETSIQVWATLNHADRGRRGYSVFPDMQWMVDWTGIESNFIACPLCQNWRDYIVRLYQLYASVEPEVLWVDDDFRLFNHSPVTFGCFCNLHLKAFSDKVKHKVSRKELVRNILFTGKPHSYRSLWFKLNGDIMIEVAQILERAVHEISTKTKLGLMTSDPESHAIEGRKWNNFLEALSGQYEPIVRPAMGNYHEESNEGIYLSSEFLRKTIFCIPNNSKICPELENYEYTQFSKSARFSRLQIALSLICKSTGITLNLYDYLGTSMNLEPIWGKMLKESKSFFNGLASVYLPNGKEKGVGLIFHSRASDYIYTAEGKEYKELYSHESGFAYPIQACGISVTWEYSDVIAVTGQIFRALDKEQIISFLSKGVLLDVSSLNTLIEMGYGKYLGATIKREAINWDVPVTAEKIIVPGFSLYKDAYMTLTKITPTEKICELSIDKNAKIISMLVDYDRNEIMPGMVVFENELSGRIAIIPFDLHKGITKHFLNWHRKRQLVFVVKWLNKGRLPLLVEGGAQMLPLRTDYKDYTLVSIINLNSDRMDSIAITIEDKDGKFGRIEMLNKEGKWIEPLISKRTEDDEHLKVEFSVPLESLDISTFLFHKK